MQLGTSIGPCRLESPLWGADISRLEIRVDYASNQPERHPIDRRAEQIEPDHVHETAHDEVIQDQQPQQCQQATVYKAILG
jgi:hypothetical protein